MRHVLHVREGAGCYVGGVGDGADVVGFTKVVPSYDSVGLLDTRQGGDKGRATY